MIFPSLKETLKQTTSRCPTCQAAVPAEVWKTTGTPSKVYLTRTCAEHGEATACISSDARFYWLAKGDPSNACGASCACAADPNGINGTLGRNAGATVPEVEVLSTCLALIEIVDSCNLACPTCFADSPVGAAGDRLKSHSLESLQSRIRGVVERKGKIELLQLSGGEPTLHPQFFELLDWIHAEPGIDYCLVNTNGVRIAKEDGFLAALPPPVASVSTPPTSSSAQSSRPLASFGLRISRRCPAAIPTAQPLVIYCALPTASAVFPSLSTSPACKVSCATRFAMISLILSNAAARTPSWEIYFIASR